MDTEILSPYRVKCNWCGYRLKVADSYACQKHKVTYFYEPGNDEPENVTTATEDFLHFCNRSHMKEFLYGC